MLVLNLINVCAQCGQTGRNTDKIPRHTSEVNYVSMVLHCALLPVGIAPRELLNLGLEQGDLGLVGHLAHLVSSTQ